MFDGKLESRKKHKKYRFTYPQEFQGNQFEAFNFEAFDDFTDKSTLDTVWFDHDISAFLIAGHFFSYIVIQCQ